jgi:hypothetical protein
LDRTRTNEKANELTAFTPSIGTVRASPTTDLAGNMTTLPQPNSPGSSFMATYDAWNRLVAVTDGAGSAMKSYVPFSLSNRHRSRQMEIV